MVTFLILDMKEKLKVAVVDMFTSLPTTRLCEALESRGRCQVFFVGCHEEHPSFKNTNIPIKHWKRSLTLSYRTFPLLPKFISQRLIPHLLRALNEIDPHIVNVHEHVHICTSFPPALFRGSWRTILTEHGCRWKRKRDKILTPLAKYFLFPLIDGFVAITPAARKFLEANGAKDVRVIGNPINVRLFYPQKRIDERENIVLFVGRLHPIKGLTFLFLAMKELTHEIPDIRLLIVGSGPLEPIVRKLSSKHDFIHYLGSKSSEELPKYYNTAKVFVLPSIHEPFGMVLAEAMACGTPVIGSNIEGIPYVIGDAGITVAPKNYKALKRAIKSILKNEDLAKTLSRKGRKRVEKLFSYETVAEKYEMLFHDILAETS